MGDNLKVVWAEFSTSSVGVFAYTVLLGSSQKQYNLKFVHGVGRQWKFLNQNSPFA
jgi:hypothetical protein